MIRSGLRRHDGEAWQLINTIAADGHHQVGLSDFMLSFEFTYRRLCLCRDNSLCAGGKRNNDVAWLPEAD